MKDSDPEKSVTGKEEPESRPLDDNEYLEELLKRRFFKI